MTEGSRTRAIREDDVGQLQMNQIAAPAACVEQKVEHGIRSDIVPEFEFPQKSPDFLAIKALWGQCGPPEFLHWLPGVGHKLASFHEPAEEPPDQDESPVDGGYGEPPLLTQV
jgi:hypothetical protein